MKKLLLLLLIHPMCQFAFAQSDEIIFIDYEPDLCVAVTTPNYTSDTIKIDFDQDGLIDFQMYIDMATSADDRIPHVKSSWLGRDHWADGDTLVPSNYYNWNPANYEWGLWFYPPDMYNFDLRLGYRKVVDSLNYYAWIDIHAHRDDSWGVWAYVDKYAYCPIPNYQLKWGQTSLYDIIANHNSLSTTIHPNPTNGLVTITGENIKEIEVINILGQPVLKTPCSGESVTIELAGQPAGVYFISLTDKKGKKYSERIIKD
ncbi:MAG: T9SS type A sorting domain-containing protein [Bacteroidales bacterium]|jgi:hypothetical protein|nr:T9SS type A sorting domain-containing protein [Bacteroidales bacterium]MBQ3844318.1 T9SS type A sorting domain-containing protein [Bacteroidales bacterium]